MAFRVAASGPALRRGRVWKGHVGRTTHGFGAQGEVFGQRYQSVTLQGQDQICQHVAGEKGGEGPRCITGFPVRHECPTTRHRGPQEASTRVCVRHQATLGDRENWRMTSLQLTGLIERMGNEHALSGIRQRLGQALEQRGVTTCEEDHDLSLGRCANAVKGRDRLRIDFEDLGS